MGAQGSKGSTKPSSAVHLRGKKDLAGVGVIFRKNHEGFLIVKDLVGGSAADQSGLIEPGDMLTQVDDIKVAKASIAEISSLVLGEPGQQVKLKFVRMVGKSKKKYKVTHIHLDCLQDQDLSKGASVEESHARDVLDADGNVVGPGLIQRAKAAKEQDVFGVERIDASHPAWPGNNLKRNVVAQGNLNTEAQVTKSPGEKKKKKSTKTAEKEKEKEAERSMPSSIPSSSDMYMKSEEMTKSQTREQKKQVVEANKDSGSLSQEQEVSNLFDSFMDPFFVAAAAAEDHSPASVLHPLPATKEDDDVPEAVVTVEDAEEADTPDWEGIAQSRVLVFEAKSREQKAEKPKKVDLEKEWAKTAAKQSSDPPPSVKACAGSELSTSSLTSLQQTVEPPVKEEKKPLKPVVKKTSPRASDAPKKMGGKGDLAALMAARKKQMDEADDDGYYF
ncbi:hypothetical protein GUITHDRAFT_113557 [Guillardia theta CCMP2712]|uniref:PDZ domain-containing protein n=1 Tax=Guillardia theta (strain CCMP2712) TaxID=905079 RepID=L1IVP5_GUITC|nr:hypothetical protein GUITHDRAFT_113557 [Guillardia theta CCMP2712]EKX40318.1 hypothetical protein GUITHDRAFT_113557 [Guillardia theta CCMP2712]|eukprot:XP_005827298.1 hypothetical protein GUITHDRAFT_113557 [Guillardia theta CCMP2712]